MKSPASALLRPALIALWFAATFALRAQEAPVATPAPPPAGTAPADSTATEAAKSEAPKAEQTPNAPAAPTAEAPPTPEADARKTEEKELRRIDEPESAPESGSIQRRRGRSSSGEFPLGDHIIAKGRHVREAVSIFGSTTVEGETSSDAVSVFGDTTIARDAEVHGAAVAVMGRLHVEGRVHRDAVNVMGTSNINSHVGGEAVAVLSDLHLGPNAVIDGDLVVVGGTVTRDPAAVVHGNEVRVPFLGGFGGFEGLATWVKKCLMLGRPLAFDANLMWAWWIALAFLGFYAILALLFRSGVEKCVQTFETRPGSTIVAALLTVLLAPVLTVLLVLTMVGAVVVPFLGVALFFATLFGKAVVLAWLGRRITKLFGDGPLNHPAIAVILGGIIILALYTVPVLGFVMYKLLGVLGLGIVVYTLILRSQREKAAAATVPPRRPTAAVMPAVILGEPPPISASGSPFTATSGEPLPSASATAAGTAPSQPMPAVPLNTLPRAGFWIRTGALALDVVLIAIILALVNGILPQIIGFHRGPGSMLPVLAIYGAVMWKLKGTTIGGIVCGLKVVRVDGREVDWATAIVRALGCFLSLAVAGLGFIWVVIDDDKQSWHDKIAGTTVVRVPKGMALV